MKYFSPLLNRVIDCITMAGAPCQLCSRSPAKHRPCSHPSIVWNSHAPLPPACCCCVWAQHVLSVHFHFHFNYFLQLQNKEQVSSLPWYSCPWVSVTRKRRITLQLPNIKKVQRQPGGNRIWQPKEAQGWVAHDNETVSPEFVSVNTDSAPFPHVPSAFKTSTA